MMEAARFLYRLQVQTLFKGSSKELFINNYAIRNFASTSKPLSAFFKSGSNPKETDEEKKKEKDNDDSDKQGWLTKMMSKKIETGSESHSNLLAVKDIVYELQMHKVRPDCMDEYLDEYQKFTNMVTKWGTGGELVGSWTVEVGDLDEAIHIWKYPGGYHTLDKHKTILRHEQEFKDFRKRRNVLLRSRVNQTLLAFSFWCDIKQRHGQTTTNIYELRSYLLKPGTMIDWGNSWARGLKYRQTDQESVAGFFSHIGELYQAHHLWAYDNLAAREEVRDSAWDRDGWHECVANTVPLVRSMVSRILIPTRFSPLK